MLVLWNRSDIERGQALAEGREVNTWKENIYRGRQSHGNQLNGGGVG